MLVMMQKAANDLNVHQQQLRFFAEHTGITSKIMSEGRIFYAFTEEQIEAAKHFFKLRKEGYNRVGAAKKTIEDLNTGAYE